MFEKKDVMNGKKEDTLTLYDHEAQECRTQMLLQIKMCCRFIPLLLMNFAKYRRKSLRIEKN